MDDVHEWEQRLLANARQRRAMPEDARARILAGIRQGIAQDVPEPAWQTPDAGLRVRRLWPVAVLIGFAAAASVALLLRPSLSERVSQVAPQQAAYGGDAEDAPHGRSIARSPVSDPPPVSETAVVTEPTLVPSTQPVPPEVAPPASKRRRAKRTTEPAELPTSDVAGETLLLREAQRALGEERWGAAIEALDTYERRFPEGTLRAEAHGVRVLVDCRREAPGAAARAEQYGARYPSSVLRSRIQKACSGTQRGPAPQ